MSSKRFIANGHVQPNAALPEELLEEGSEQFENERFARRITSYLLEELSEEESEQFEDECFDGKNWPAQVRLGEEDLIDAYLRDELSPEQRQRFERNYLTTQARQKRVRVAAAQLRHIDEHQSPVKETDDVPQSGQTWAERFRAFWGSRNGVPRIAFALVTIAVIANAWWIFDQRTLPPQGIATLTLNVSNSDRARGAQDGRVLFTRDTSTLKISLILPVPSAQAVSYRVQLKDDNGEIKTSEIAGQDAQSVAVSIPAAQLTRGQYALKLYAVKTDGTEHHIGNYFFIVE